MLGFGHKRCIFPIDLRRFRQSTGTKTGGEIAR